MFLTNLAAAAAVKQMLSMGIKVFEGYENNAGYVSWLGCLHEQFE